MNVSQTFEQNTKNLADALNSLTTNHLEQLETITKEIQSCIFLNRQLLICGNGGSNSDAQHFAAELIGRFKKDRPGFNAKALGTDVATLTAIANDFGYEKIFSRQIESTAFKRDVVIFISTSGNSVNILKGIETSKAIGCTTILLGGKDGGKAMEMVDYALVVPSNDTAIIQQVHTMLYHSISEYLENRYMELTNV